MKSAIFLFFTMFNPFFCIGQHILKGKVIDAKTEQPVRSAVIKLKNNYCLSNEKGEFSIDCNTATKSNLIITHVSYNQQQVNIDSIYFLIIKLTKSENSLPEVVVSSQAEDIITKSIKNIPLNYAQHPFVQDFAVIMRHKMEEEKRNAFFYGSINALVRAKYSGYKKNTSSPEVYLMNNTISRYVSTNSLLDTTRYCPNWYQPNVHDIVHKRALFLSNPDKKLYQYYLSDKLLYNNRKSYKIEFSHKKDTSLKGYIYIDSATYAIVFISYTKTNVKQLLFRTIKKNTNTITYKLIGSKWYVDEATKENHYALRGQTTLSYGYSGFKSILIDTLLEATTNNLLLIDHWADVYTVFSKNTTLPIVTYQPQFNNLEAKAIENSQLADTQKNKLPESKTTGLINKIGKYFSSSKVGITFFVAKGTLSFAGEQNYISKRISNISEYIFGNSISLAFYRTWAFHIISASNYGLGGVNYAQNLIGTSIKIENPKLTIQPIVGFSRNTITDKQTNIFATSNGLMTGFNIYPKRRTRFVPHLSAYYYKEFYNNNAPIQVQNKGFQIAIGVLLK